MGNILVGRYYPKRKKRAIDLILFGVKIGTKLYIFAFYKHINITLPFFNQVTLVEER